MTHLISPKTRFVTMTSVAALMAVAMSGTSAHAACNEAVVGVGMIVTTCSLDTKSGYKETVMNATTINILASASVNNDVAGTIAIETAGLRDSITTQVGGKSEIRGKDTGIRAVDSNVVITNEATNTIMGGIVGVEFVRGSGDVRNNGNITGGTGAGLHILNSGQGTFLNGAGGKITSGSGAGVEFNTNFGNTLKNYGMISGGGMAVGVLGGAGGETVENVGTITGGGVNAINLGDGGNILRNGKIDNMVTGMGNISGSVTMGKGQDIIENHAVIGTVMSPVVIDLGDNQDTLTNGGTGVIHGEVIMGAGDDEVVNDGAIAIGIINKNVDLGEGSNKLTNTGQWDPAAGIRKGIFGSVLAGAGNDEIVNSGAIGGNVNVGDGRNIVTNTGGVGASILGGLGGFHTVTNGVGGKVFGGVDLGDNADTLTNNGEIMGNVWMRGGDDALVNTGGIGGSIDLGVGNDNLTLTMGMGVGGVIDGGAGDDQLFLNGGVAGQRQFFRNQVANMEILTKQGGGTWVLDRDYTFNTLIQVLDGDLNIAAGWTLTSAKVVSVAMAGRLSGEGRLAGGVVVKGTLHPGDGTTGKLTVTGNVTMDAGSFVEVSVGPGTAQTQLAVGGSVNLGGNGTLTVAVAPGLYRNGASYDVITAGVAVNGQFGLTTLPAGTKFTKFKVNYTVPRVVQVLVEKINYATIGNTYNQRQAGDGLFRGMAGSGAGSDMETVAEAFERLGANDDAYRAALDSLSGEAWAAMGEVRSGVTRNFRALGMGRIDGNLEGVGVWGNVLQGQEDVKGDGNGERIRGDVRGLVGGVEYGFGGGKVGVMVGYGQGGLKLGARGEGEVKLMMGGVYGGWNFGGIEVSGGVSYASGKQKVTRSIVGSWLPNQRNMRGSEQVREFGMDVGVGYGINLGMIKVTPEVGLEMARVYEQGFEEKGGNSVSLSGEKEKGWEGRGHVRVEVSAVFQAGLVSFEPYVKGGYERVLVGKGYQDRDVSFQQPGTAFNVRSTDGSKNIYTGGGGLNVGFGPVTVGVGYQQSIGGKRDERTFQGSLGIRW
ncbi:MAG: autotransporter outer membrane beta-barrel domain-containing protein [Rhodospirillaceae bacterium]|nr:autotransporter outer membrane beta-barrel domain-containing protein [Rhodospirillaceae bacterium]